MIIDDDKLDAVFDDVSRHVRSSVRQPRASIIRDARRRLSQNANDVAAIHVIAAACLLEQQANVSLSTLQKESTALSGNATGQRLAGYACLAQEMVDAAMLHFDAAVRIDPGQYDSWAMMGGIQEETGQQERAISYYQRAMVFDDKNHESALALSRLYSVRKDLKEAIHTLRVSIIRDQRSAKLNLALAKLLEKRADVLRRLRKWTAVEKVLEEACRCYRIVVASVPTVSACVALGLLEQKLDRHDASKAAFQLAVKLNPDSALAMTHLANVHVDSGEIDRAIECFHRSLEIDPRRAGTHFRYTRAKRFKPGTAATDYVAKLTALVSEKDRPRSDQVHLNFALAKVLDDLGEYDDAWQHYDRGNRLKPGHHVNTKSAGVPLKSTGVNSKSAGQRACPLQDLANDMMRFYTREFFECKRGLGNPSVTPVFIVGMPRSGTTLTEQILSSHPAIAGAGELKQIERIRQRIVFENRGPGQGRPTTSADRNIYPDVMMSVSDNRLRELADQHISHLDGLRSDETHVTDKMPTNFMHLGLIALLFPKATIIHCRRNPMDVLVSSYCQNLSAPFCDMQALVSYHREYRRLMAYWQDVLPLKIHNVDYESLVTDPEPNARMMIEHCGLDWDERCLAFHANRRAVHTPSKWQVRQPMYSSSIDRWKRFAAQLEPISRQIELELQRESSPAFSAAVEVLDAVA